MRYKHLIQALTGTKQIVCESIEMNEQVGAINIIAHPDRKSQCRCGICQKKCPRYDKGRGMRRWRCLDIGSTPTYILSESYRVSCPDHGVVTAYVPWARHKTGFCSNFEDTIAWLSVHSSRKAISELMRVEWHTVGEICDRVYKNLESQSQNRFDGLVNIGIDETSYKKGHKYMTVVVNHDTSSVIWCAIGYGKEVLKSFFKQLSDEQRKTIRCVSADGAQWITDCVSEYCPNAERCIDPFHVVSWATEALDQVRRQAWAEANREAKSSQKKRSRGRPPKGEETDPVKEKANSLKRTKYALLKNPENLTENQQAQLSFLTAANPKLYRAYLLKENLRLALKADSDEIGILLIKWMAWAQRCRIPEFRDLRKKIKRNFSAIIATAKFHLSNARIEAINNKIKLVIRTAFGFRNTDHLLSLVMLNCSDVHVALPQRS